MKNTFHVYLLLDKSGSMQSLWGEAIGSINSYVKELPRDTRITLAAFDSQSYDILRDTSAGYFNNLNEDEVKPGAMTPLYDSSVRLMQRALEDKADRVVFVVMTDGFENASRRFNKFDVKSLIRQFEQKNWQVVFLGADFDKVETQAHDIGVNYNTTMNITRGNLGQTMSNFATATASYGLCGSAINFSEQERAAASGKYTVGNHTVGNHTVGSNTVNSSTSSSKHK